MLEQVLHSILRELASLVRQTGKTFRAVYGRMSIFPSPVILREFCQKQKVSTQINKIAEVTFKDLLVSERY